MDVHGGAHCYRATDTLDLPFCLNPPHFDTVIAIHYCTTHDIDRA